MQEGQVTIGEDSFPLPQPFLVLATQNPLEQEGTYPLPEAQVDRFMLKLHIPYPNREEELQILERMAHTQPHIEVKSVVSPADILQLREVVDSIYLDDKIKQYIVDIVYATREPQDYKLDLGHYIEYGASPRATIYLALASKAAAFLRGARLRDAGGRQVDRHGRAAPPRPHHLRSGGVGRDGRTHRAADFRATCRCLESAQAGRALCFDPLACSHPTLSSTYDRFVSAPDAWCGMAWGGEYHSAFKGRGMEFSEGAGIRAG